MADFLKNQNDVEHGMTDTDKVGAACYILNLYYKSKIYGTEETFLSAVNDALHAKTKAELDAIVNDVVEL